MNLDVSEASDTAQEQVLVVPQWRGGDPDR